MKALVNTRCNDQSVQLISIMCLCTRVHLSWNMCIISRQGGEEKSIKGNIPIGFSLCHRPVSAGPMHRSRAQQHVDDLLTSTRGRRFGGHSGYIRGLPGTKITDWMREKKKRKVVRKLDWETSWNKHSGSFGFVLGNLNVLLVLTMLLLSVVVWVLRQFIILVNWFAPDTASCCFPIFPAQLTCDNMWVINLPQRQRMMPQRS